MSKIEKNFNDFKNNSLSKVEYIDEMYKIHQNLIDYSKYIVKTGINKIEITDNNVLIYFRESNVIMKFIEGDKRIACIDSLNFHKYEEEELFLQYKLIDSNDIIFDIGGNYGWYAMHVAKENPNSQIYSFEPVPNTFKILNQNIQINKIVNIKTFNIGLSDKTGEFSFYCDPNLTVNASLNNVSENSKAIEIKCEVSTLDSFVFEKKIDKLDYIKCDIEGAELLALKGAENTIIKYKPKIFIEMLRKWTKKFDYHPNDIISYLKKLGYNCYTINEKFLIQIFEITEVTIETNFVFLHSIKHQNKISNLTIK